MVENTIVTEKTRFVLIYHFVVNGFANREEVLLSAKKEEDAMVEAKKYLEKVQRHFKMFNNCGFLKEERSIIRKEIITIEMSCSDLNGNKYKTSENAQEGEKFFDGESVQKMVTKKTGITTRTLGMGDSLCTTITSKNDLLDLFDLFDLFDDDDV